MQADKDSDYFRFFQELVSDADVFHELYNHVFVPNDSLWIFGFGAIHKPTFGLQVRQSNMWVDFLENCPKLSKIIKLLFNYEIGWGKLDMIESVVSLQKVSRFLLCLNDFYIINNWHRSQLTTCDNVDWKVSYFRNLIVIWNKLSSYFLNFFYGAFFLHSLSLHFIIFRRLFLHTQILCRKFFRLGWSKLKKFLKFYVALSDWFAIYSFDRNAGWWAHTHYAGIGINWITRSCDCLFFWRVTEAKYLPVGIGENKLFFFFDFGLRGNDMLMLMRDYLLLIIFYNNFFIVQLLLSKGFFGMWPKKLFDNWLQLPQSPTLQIDLSLSFFAVGHEGFSVVASFEYFLSEVLLFGFNWLIRHLLL